MKKSIIVVAVLALVAAVVGGAIFLSLSRSTNTADTTHDSTGGTPSNNTGAQTQPVSNATDLTSKTDVDVSMRDISFSPANIKIKKGTKVTWTNNDTVAHNVVASTPSSSGGLPLSQATFGKGQTFSHTFETIGTFPYYCTPHPFMKGSVEVVE